MIKFLKHITLMLVIYSLAISCGSKVTSINDGEPNHSDNITLQWDHNSDADYYIVYWGTESQNYTESSNTIDVPVTSYNIKHLSSGTYYFTIKAFNDFDNSSDFSDEIKHVVVSNQ